MSENEEGVTRYVSKLTVSFESAGGMGEIDAIEEGLKAIIENPDNPTKFEVESMSTIAEKLKEFKEEKPVELPEGVTLAKFEFQNEVYAKIAENIFELILAKAAEFRSAVNIKTMVRTVMYKKGEKTGAPYEMYTKDNENAWSLQQTIDWTYRDIIEVVAVKRDHTILEVAYTKKGLKAPPPKEKMIYAFKKTDGWKLVGKEK